jgi:GNAT superfamily N-acetyltransferase
MIRPAKPDELNYILETWLLKSRPRSTFARDMHFTHGKDLIALLLSRSVVIVDAQNDRIRGWLVYELFEGRCVLHFAYTRQEYRGTGIATSLVEAAAKGAPVISSRYLGRKCTKPIDGDGAIATYLALSAIKQMHEES